jgi:hypothetical protein
MTNLVTGPVTQPETVIQNRPWFPDISPEKIREAQRIDTTISPARLRGVLIDAMTHVNDQLRLYRIEQSAAGVGSLSDVEADVIDVVSVKVSLYQRAVGCLAKASLLERYRDFDTSGRAVKEAEQLDQPISDLRRDAQWAISDLVGRPRTTCELI